MILRPYLKERLEDVDITLQKSVVNKANQKKKKKKKVKFESQSLVPNIKEE